MIVLLFDYNCDYVDVYSILLFFLYQYRGYPSLGKGGCSISMVPECACARLCFNKSESLPRGRRLVEHYTDNGESPLTDPDQPYSSSYDPTPINVPTEAATPINISTEGPKTKKTKVTKK